MLDRSDIERLIPHKGLMCLLELVVSWDDRRIEVVSGTHRDPDNPLRSAQGLRAFSLCEYGAQAMALHGALLLSGGLTETHETYRPTPTYQPTPGMLATLRQVRTHCEYVHSLPGDLTVFAERVHGIDSLVQYDFRVTHENTVLVEGRATVVLQPPGSSAT